LQSKVTGTRFTYRVLAPVCEPNSRRRDYDAAVRFVKVLVGPDNGNDFRYAGFIKDGHFVHGNGRAKIGPEAPSVKAIGWFVEHLGATNVSFWHEGSCGRCGRALTVPESIESGLGPVCAARA